MSEDLKWGIIFVSAMTMVIGILVGMIDGGEERGRGKPGCEYHSIIGYMPGRVIGCELVRRRW